MNVRTLLPLLLLTLVHTTHAQVAADETLQLAATTPSPWGKPLSPAMPQGTTMRLAPHAMEGPAPLQCPGATHRFVPTPATDLFEGNLPAPANRSAQSLGLPAGIVTQRISCSNGGFDVHRSADGRAWIGLDNAVLQWARVSIAATPEATVQELLIHHVAGGMTFSVENVAAQRPWLSEALFEKLNRWFARVAKSDEAPYLNGDPYTDSQEPPDTFEVAGLGAARSCGVDGDLSRGVNPALPGSFPAGSSAGHLARG